jgi:hypothetical protein
MNTPYVMSVDIYLNLMKMRDMSQAELTFDAVEDLGIAAQDNRDAQNECDEVLSRPLTTGYNNLMLGSCTIATLQ